MTDTPEKTLPQVCEEIGLRLEIYRKPRDVHDVSTEGDGDKKWKHYSYLVGIRYLHNVVQDIPWKQGTGFVKKQGSRTFFTLPKVEDVVFSLVLDSDACDLSFDDWCSNYGYDTDSRKALAVYLKCQELGVKIRKLLGKHFEAVRKAAQEY